MKIFLAFLQGKANHPIPAYSFWEYYMKNGIAEGQDSWIEDKNIDWAEGLMYEENSKELNSWKDRTWSRTLEFVKINRPDIFLCYLYPKQVDVSAIREIIKLGIPCVNFFCDHIRDFKRLPKEFSAFSLNWVPEVDALNLYKELNLPHIHLPMPMWVQPKFRVISQKHTSDITFIGSCDIQRKIFFNKFLEQDNSEVKIYGKGWMDDDQYLNPFEGKKSIYSTFKNQFNFINNQGLIAFKRKIIQKNVIIGKSQKLQQSIHGKVSFDEYIALTKNSLATIGINRYPSYRYPLNTPKTYSRLRDIEAPMLGALYITENTPDIGNIYPNNEILTFENHEDLLQKISFVKRNSKFRYSLIAITQKTALGELNIPNSINSLKKRL